MVCYVVCCMVCCLCCLCWLCCSCFGCCLCCSCVVFLNPSVHVLEGVFVCDVVHQNHTLSSSIVIFSDGAELLLSCRVPYLHFDPATVHHTRPDPEIDSDCGLSIFGEGALRVASDQTGLPRCAIANGDEANVCLFGDSGPTGAHRRRSLAFLQAVQASSTAQQQQETRRVARTCSPAFCTTISTRLDGLR